MESGRMHTFNSCYNSRIIYKKKGLVSTVVTPVLAFDDTLEVLPPYWNSSGGDLGSMGVTDASKSTMTVITRASTLTLGDIIQVRIDAKDINGRQRALGGDFWSAQLTNRQSLCSVPGKFVDHNNGTYNVYFRAACSGVTKIEISLIHSREAVQFLNTQYINMQGKVFWKGSFGNEAETQMCIILRDGTWSGKCEYRYKTGLGRSLLLCDKPKNSSCADLDFLTVLFPSPKLKEFLNKHSDLFHKPKSLKGTPFVLTVESAKNHTIASSVPCNLDHHVTTSTSKPTFTGHWFKDSWISEDCKVKIFDQMKTRNCLKYKNIYMFGDSTTKQLFEDLTSNLAITGKEVTWDPQYANLDMKGHTYLKKIRGAASFAPNISIHFHFNPLMVTANRVRITDYIFEDEILDNLKECNYIITMSPWAHYTSWTPESYLERLAYIKNSLKQLKTRCPDTVIIVKGTHPREKPSLQSLAYNSDWVLYTMNKQLKTVFDEDWLVFLDVWDLNQSYLGGKTIHMPKLVIHQELLLLLSDICPE
ncbi:NXPE family member 3-like [Glandiceps talaboti]